MYTTHSMQDHFAISKEQFCNKHNTVCRHDNRDKNKMKSMTAKLMKSLFFMLLLLLCFVQVFGKILRKNDAISQDLLPAEAIKRPESDSKTQNDFNFALPGSGHVGKIDGSFEMTTNMHYTRHYKSRANMTCKQTTPGMNFYMRTETFLRK